MYGMLFSKLTDKLLAEIIVLYDKIVGGNGTFHIRNDSPWRKLDYVKRSLESRNQAEWRYGSILSMNSKLLVIRESWFGKHDQIIRFAFYGNLDGQKRKEKSFKKAFKKAVDEFLLKKGLAVKLKTGKKVRKPGKKTGRSS